MFEKEKSKNNSSLNLPSVFTNSMLSQIKKVDSFRIPSNQNALCCNKNLQTDTPEIDSEIDEDSSPYLINRSWIKCTKNFEHINIDKSEYNCLIGLQTYCGIKRTDSRNSSLNDSNKSRCSILPSKNVNIANMTASLKADNFRNTQNFVNPYNLKTNLIETDSSKRLFINLSKVRTSKVIKKMISKYTKSNLHTRNKL